MKKNNGITIIALVVAITILLLLSTVSVQVSLMGYNAVNAQKFIAEMEVIQAAVDNFVEENGNNPSVYASSFSTAIPSNLKKTSDLTKIDVKKLNINTNKSWDNALDLYVANYYYFTSSDLEEKLGIKDADINVIINFKTRNIIAVNGIKLDGEKYYRQYDVRVEEN